MSVKTAFPAALVITVLSLSVAHAQYPPAPPSRMDPVPPAPPDGPTLPPAPKPALAKPSDWITGANHSSWCCGPVGGDGPIGTELYVRTGPAFNIGGRGILSDTLESGWVVQGGARSLFFNPDRTAAWAVDFSISNVWNHGKNDHIKAPLTILVPPADPTGTPQTVRFGRDVPGVTVRDLNRTFVNLGGGREWYVLEPADAGCWLWRWGFDVGGRWGSASMQLHELRHRTDVIGGVWAAVHSDVEIPFRCGTFIVGLRLEGDYTWTDILQRQNNTDIIGLNLLMNFGVRY